VETTPKFVSSVTLPSTPPSTSFEFESFWNPCKNNVEIFSKYLELIPPSSYANLLKNSMTEEMFDSIIEAISLWPIPENIDRTMQTLSNLILVPRIDMILMFLSDKSKKKISQLFEKISNSKKNYSEEQIESLKKQFLS